MKNLFRITIGLLMAVVSFSALAQEQQGYAVYGQVSDLNGEPVGQAEITLGEQLHTHTDASGAFKFQAAVSFPLTLKVTVDEFLKHTTVLTASSYDAEKGLHIFIDNGDVALGEVIVSAKDPAESYLTGELSFGHKFAGTIQELPQSVSVVGAQLMADKGAYTLQDVIQDVAGVTQTSSYDDVILRGFKSGYNTGNRLVNGLRSAYGHGSSYYRSPLTINLQRIEVLKGPSATLFGTTVPGGVINMITKKPTDEKLLSVGFAAGSFHTLRTNIDLGGPLNEEKTILYRLNAGYKYSETFKNINTYRDFMIAPSFAFKPREGTQINVDLVYDQFKGYLYRGMGLESGDYYALPRSFTFAQPSDFYNTKTLNFSLRFQQRLSAHANLHLGYMSSIYQEDVNEHRTLNSYANPPVNTIMNIRFFDRHAKEYTNSAVAYVDWDLPGGLIDQHLVAGVDYSGYRGDKNNQLREAREKYVDGEVVPLTFDMNNPTYTAHDLSKYIWRDNVKYYFLSPYQTVGVYAHDQFSIADRFKLILGLRYEHYKSESTDLDDPFHAVQESWLPRAGLTYKLNNQINLFASYSQGFTPVGANFVHNYADYGATKPFSPETSYQLEFGVKAEFFRNHLQADLSIFQIKKENMMMATGSLTDNGLPIYRQSGSVQSRGVEVQLRGEITDGLVFRGNYSFNPTEVQASSVASEVGQALPGAPEHMASLWAKYTFHYSKLKGLGFGAGVYYVGDRRMDNSIGINSEGAALWGSWPSYTTVDAAVYYQFDHMKLAVNLNNVFDEYYFLGGFDYTRAFPGAPRNFMVSLTYSL